MKRNPKEKKAKRLMPLSLYPLKPEEALREFLKIDPKKVKMQEQKMKKK